MSCFECCCCWSGAIEGCRLCQVVRNPKSILVKTHSAVVVKSEEPQGQIHLIVIPKKHLNGRVFGEFHEDDLAMLLEWERVGRSALEKEAKELNMEDYESATFFYYQPGEHMALNFIANPLTESAYPQKQGRIPFDDIIRSLSGPQG